MKESVIVLGSTGSTLTVGFVRNVQNTEKVGEC